MPNKKILILVLSYTNEPYLSLLRAQQQTWYSEGSSTVKIFFYHGGLSDRDGECVRWPKGELQFKAPDDYYMMHWKFKLALDAIWDRPWDIIFRTNSSSYVNIKKLEEYCATLPTEKVYGGWTIGPDINDDGGYFVSGAGMFLTRDYADILRKELQNQFECEEDVLIGRILRKHGARPFDDQSRVDYTNSPHLQKSYHVRFKTGNRLRDAQNMIDYHKNL